MTKRFLGMMFVAGLTTACGNPLAPAKAGSASDEFAGAPTGAASTMTAQTLVGAPYTGTTHANGIGQSGTDLTMTFSQADGSIIATADWTGTTSQHFTGTVAGTLDNLTVTTTGGCGTFKAIGNFTTNGTTETFSGTYSASCHRAADAVYGDTGTFTLSRPVASTPSPTPTPTPTPTCTFTVSPLNFGTAAAPLDHNAHANQTVTIVASAPTCAWTAVSNNPDWIKGVRVVGINPPTVNGTGNGTVSFDVEGNKNVETRNGTLTVAGQTVTVYQDKDGTR
jgi:hypothetical protein